MNFARFQRPSRYIGGEVNAFPPRAFQDGGGRTVRCALAFPDLYEVGMSHLGLKILYGIINDLPFASAERVFAPWPDLEGYLRREGLPLTTLESASPLSEFDIVGFSLQYELSYTTVLNMLSLGGIPVRSSERWEKNRRYPLVLAGGPCTVNPAPMAPFIDAFLIGDGEDAVPQIISTVMGFGRNGDRDSLLRALADIEGVYVPQVHNGSLPVRRRIVTDLDGAFYPVRPVVPYTSIVHDRIAIEVSRGCTKGCRFCQAGMVYRPRRDRSPGRVLSIAGEALRNTGYEEVSFTSLSTGDYPHLLPLVHEFNRRFASSRVALSLPSLRVASVNQDVLREIRTVRKTGFTMAPEAATERLRCVINKDFSDEDYERALTALFAEGWLNLKLYFMIGLPTETEEDRAEIPRMVMRALKIARKATGKFVTINVTVSPFVPKPHTPFQWFGQIPVGEMRRISSSLRTALNKKQFVFKGHREEMSMLEAMVARGDERISLLIEEAWRGGCRLDGWSDHFDYDAWRSAMDRTGIDGFHYAQREFGPDDPLPWDFVDVGVQRSFLLGERERALSVDKTPDCRENCLACGLDCGPVEAGTGEVPHAEVVPPGLKLPGDGSQTVRVRVRFSKTGRLAYLSHLELMVAILRALRRAGVPLDFSRGFNPKPKVSFGPPLPVGVAGEREYFDMEVFPPVDLKFFSEVISQTLPEGIGMHDMVFISSREDSLDRFISRYAYRVSAADGTGDGHDLTVAAFPFIALRDGKSTDISGCVEEVSPLGLPVAEAAEVMYDGGGRYGFFTGKACTANEEAASSGTFRLVLRDQEHMKVRLGEIIQAVFAAPMEEMAITRTALYGWKNGWIEPL